MHRFVGSVKYRQAPGFTDYGEAYGLGCEVQMLECKEVHWVEHLPFQRRLPP